MRPGHSAKGARWLCTGMSAVGRRLVCAALGLVCTQWLCTGMSTVGRRLGDLRVGLCGLRAGLYTVAVYRYEHIRH